MATPFTPIRSGTVETLPVSPLTFGSSPFSASRKRKVTPSKEASSAKRMHLYKPMIPNPLFQGKLVEHQQALSLARHIVLPFDLRLDPNAIYIHENQNILGRLFPDNNGVATDGMFVYLFHDTMPPKPWPMTIAGLPCYFAPHPGREHSPIPELRPVSSKNGSIHGDINGKNMEDWTPLFDLIRGSFQDLGISITEVMYWSNYVIIVLEHRNTDISKLPRKAANIICSYLYDDEMGRPFSPQAHRLKDPTPGNPDNSQYSTLQPGLRITSTYLPSTPDMFLSTTTGVLVRDQVGNDFMTVAAHGFPGECGTDVIHPLPANGRNIGEVIIEVSHTDIALVKLRDGETFLNIPFESEIVQGPIQLKRLATAKGRQTADEVILDSPDTGCIDGSLLVTSFQRVPSDDFTSPAQQWIFTQWIYMGQDSRGSLPDKMCGSAIFTKDGDVIGFFRYAPVAGAMKDWCAGIAADELIDRGFTLINTGGSA